MAYEKICGIYKLTSPSGKCYIGQSINLKQRINNYNNIKDKGQTIIYNAIKKYGFDNFKVDFLFQTKDITNIKPILNQLEADFINLYDCLAPNGYNARNGGDCNYEYTNEVKEMMSIACTGRVRSEDTKKNISNSMKKLVRTEEHKINNSLAKMIPILQLDNKFNIIKEWDSATSVELKLKISKSNINNVLKGKRNSAGGFIWKYKKEMEVINE